MILALTLRVTDAEETLRPLFVFQKVSLAIISLVFGIGEIE